MLEKNYGEILVPAKKCCFQEGKLNGILNNNFIMKTISKNEVQGILPIKGFKTWIYHPGQKITCTKCYNSGHFARDFPYKAVKWIDQVYKMRKSSSIETTEVEEKTKSFFSDTSD
ncbi:unnamed protein product [Lepeophtheirus salmonis]|uniref:(salmon louse) hypothetical protein n=1 Tax=Lepeophtheirus salmonis TaxID=72036 RepID=A0A817FB42_LEPSM|nr:unnamed protein product [Lepeophtheirus salmonis]CAG9476370.1 unnamed protein product [Lepeophtheirus salmonis]